MKSDKTIGLDDERFRRLTGVKPHIPQVKTHLRIISEKVALKLVEYGA